jgi:hypothetical protein
MSKENRNIVKTYTLEQINSMTKPGNHPVIKKFVRQLIIESVPVILLLTFYYDIFDGHQKPWVWHLILIVSLLLLLVHNMLGIFLVNNIELAENINQSLKHYRHKIRNFTIIALVTRLLALTGLILFLISGNLSKLYNWYSLAALLVIVVQMYILNSIWQKRIKNIEKSMNF